MTAAEVPIITRSDAWSFGVALWELIAQDKPYKGASHSPDSVRRQQYHARSLNLLLTDPLHDYCCVPSGCPPFSATVQKNFHKKG